MTLFVTIDQTAYEVWCEFAQNHDSLICFRVHGLTNNKSPRLQEIRQHFKGDDSMMCAAVRFVQCCVPHSVRCQARSVGCSARVPAVKFSYRHPIVASAPGLLKPYHIPAGTHTGTQHRHPVLSAPKSLAPASRHPAPAPGALVHDQLRHMVSEDYHWSCHYLVASRLMQSASDPLLLHWPFQCWVLFTADSCLLLASSSSPCPRRSGRQIINRRWWIGCGAPITSTKHF